MRSFAKIKPLGKFPNLQYDDLCVKIFEPNWADWNFEYTYVYDL